LQTTPAEGGGNIIRSPESDSLVEAATTSPEVRAVVETQAPEAAPTTATAVSNVKTDFEAWAKSKLIDVAEPIDFAASPPFVDPQLDAQIGIDGTLRLAFASGEVKLPAFAIRQLVDFLEDTISVWE
jgi:hypothetical protein